MASTVPKAVAQSGATAAVGTADSPALAVAAGAAHRQAARRPARVSALSRELGTPTPSSCAVRHRTCVAPSARGSATPLDSRCSRQLAAVVGPIAGEPLRQHQQLRRSGGAEAPGRRRDLSCAVVAEQLFQPDLRNVLDHRYLLDSGFVLMTMGARRSWSMGTNEIRRSGRCAVLQPVRARCGALTSRPLTSRTQGVQDRPRARGRPDPDQHDMPEQGQRSTVSYVVAVRPALPALTGQVDQPSR